MEHKIGVYKVLEHRGTNDHLIVSIAGIGIVSSNRMGYEWRGSFSSLGRQEHILFIIDTIRSCFNNQNGFDDLVCFLERYRKQYGIVKSTILGLSMGGSAAIMLSSIMRFDRVVAMAPQIYIGNKAAPWDRRYYELWRVIPEIATPDVSLCLGDRSEYVIITSIDDLLDLRHVHEIVRRLGDTPNVRVIGVRGYHNIGSQFKEEGRLDELVSKCLDGEFEFDDCTYYPVVADLTNLVVAVLERGERAVAEDIHRAVERGVGPLPAPLLNACRHGHQICLEKTVSSFGEFQSADAPLVHPLQNFRIDAPNQILQYGWSHPEQSGIWAVGLLHAIRCDLVDFGRVGAVELVLKFRCLLRDTHSRQRIEINTSDGYAANMEVAWTPERNDDVTLTIPCNSQHVDIVLRTPDHVSPLDLGIGRDFRSLSFRLAALRFRSTPRSNPRR